MKADTANPGRQEAPLVNAPVDLGAVDIELSVRKNPVRVTAQATLRLLPSPSLVIKFDAPGTGILQSKDVGPRARVLPDGVPFNISPFSISLRRSGDMVRATLRPLSQPCTIFRAPRQRLQEARFKVINFPKFMGKQDLREGDGKTWMRLVGHTQLSGGPWTIALTAVPKLDDIHTALKSQGGYAFTHSGTLARADGKTFSVKAAERALETLRQFLSFARGGFCTAALEIGLNRKGERVWQRWGAGSVLPWLYTPSWFDRGHGEHLSAVFPGFWDRYNDPKTKDTVVAGLYWYLRSNAHGHGAGIDGGIVLAQAGLERLAHDLAHSGKSAAEKLRKALQGAGIPIGIPSACRSLKRFAGKERWQDGPRAFTEIRNGLTHPVKGHGPLPKRALYEAWNLGQWYIELLLLRQIDYRGEYGNRLKKRWRGQVGPVPWK